MTFTMRFQGIAAFVFSVGIAITATSVAAQPQQAAAQQEHNRKRQLAALTMPEAARVAGEHYVRTMEVGTWAVAGDLESLAKTSDVVVVGEVISGQAALSVDEMYINTISMVRVAETIKGGVLKGTDIKVVTLGGSLKFADGKSAETATPGMEGLRPGGRYVLFLQAIDKKTPQRLLTAETRGAYVPNLGPQGVFELGRDVVKAQGRTTDPVKQQNDKTGVNAFLAKVRQAGKASGAPR